MMLYWRSFDTQHLITVYILKHNFIWGAGTYGNGTDLKEVWAVDSARGNLTRLADLPASKFELALISLPGGDVLSVAGGQHINGSEVIFLSFLIINW